MFNITDLFKKIQHRFYFSGIIEINIYLYKFRLKKNVSRPLVSKRKLSKVYDSRLILKSSESKHHIALSPQRINSTLKIKAKARLLMKEGNEITVSINHCFHTMGGKELLIYSRFNIINWNAFIIQLWFIINDIEFKY